MFQKYIFSFSEEMTTVTEKASSHTQENHIIPVLAFFHLQILL